MADETGQSLRFSGNTLPCVRLFSLTILFGLLWLLGWRPVVAPLKSVSALPEQKIAAEVRGSAPIQLGTEFCSQTVNIMPLGNSITKGYGTGAVPTDNNFNYGFRYYLFNSLSTSYYDFDFVGSQYAGETSGFIFDYDHEGWGGILGEVLAVAVPGHLLAGQPDVILLHIGTNDVAQRSDGNYAADVADVEDILDAIDAYSTEAIVVLAQIIDQDRNDLVEYQPGAVSTYNGLLATMAQNRINGGDKLMLVDMYNALDYSENGDMEIAALPDDWLHPNDSGYQKMAAVWFNALETIQPDCPPPTITTTPLTTVTVDAAYSYDVNATGEPAPTYSLVTAPSGMNINPTTGVITWTPMENQRGVHTVTVEATNFYGTDAQTFMVTVPHEIFIPIINN